MFPQQQLSHIWIIVIAICYFMTKSDTVSQRDRERETDNKFMRLYTWKTFTNTAQMPSHEEFRMISLEVLFKQLNNKGEACFEKATTTTINVVDFVY